MNTATKALVGAALTTAMTVGLTAATTASASAATGSGTVIKSGTSWPASGTGGLILRDRYGNNTGSGIGENQDFKFRWCGPKGSGLIFVTQLKRGNEGGGGWGSAYSGYVKKQYTQLPSMWSFCN